MSFTAMGRSWELTTDRGRWLAVTVYPWITAEQAEVGTRLRDAAVAAGMAAPLAVRSPLGRLVESVHADNWRVHEWLEVGPSPVLPVSSALAHRVGTAYGTLHALAIPSNTPINPYLTWRRPESEWFELLERARAAGKPWSERLEAMLPAWFELRRLETAIDPGAMILCNSNLIPTHVRQGRDGELVVMEWDFAGSMTPELELGIALNQWAMRPSVNREAVVALRRGYEEVREWPALGLESFGVAVSGWLNWAYNSMCEAVDPQDLDHAAFAEREAVGVLDRPLTRDRLEELLED